MAVAVVAAFVLAACGDGNPYTTISPRTETANDIQFLYKILFAAALVVFVGVQAFIVYTVMRFRRRAEDEERPDQIHGNRNLEILWTVVPAIVLLAIFIPTVSTLYDFAAEADAGDYTIEVYGKQWWWEVQYVEPDAVAGVITANEIYIPQGKDILFKLFTNNVIHSFWVPQLTGKVDLIPGHVNQVSFTADQPGTYYGVCAEFCGESHAWMKFQVHVVPQDQFDAFIAAWRQPPTFDADPATADVAEVPASFGVCIACHRVSGTNAQVAPVGIEQDPGTEESPGTAKLAGPNLTMFGCRNTIAAGALENTPENLALWLRDPRGLKPGNWMGTVIQEGTLSEEQITELVDYLESLKPAGGCPVVPDAGGPDLGPGEETMDEEEQEATE